MRTVVTPVALPFQVRVKNHFGSALIAHYPLDETAGTTAYDRSGHAYDGTYVSPTLAQYAGLGPKARCGFNGSATYAYLTNAGFLAALSQTEGSIALAFRPNLASLWTTAAYYDPLTISGTNNFSVAMYHADVTNDIGVNFVQNNVSAFLAANFRNGGTGWVHYVLTWSAANNQICLYRNGILVSTATPTACSGVLSYVNIGKGFVTQYWNGGIGSVIFFNRPLTAAEAKLLAIETEYERVSIIGDSISQDIRNKLWPSDWLKGYHNGQAEIVRGGVASSSILAAGGQNLATQVTNAALDDATRVIIALGTGDDNAGNMATLQAEVEEQLVELKRTNPRCVPYYLNVLPRWTNNSTGPEVAKGNIRAAIAAACAAQGVTCWDTYTTPWITQAQTTDGLHPTSSPWAGSGHEAIAAKVLEKLS